MSNKATMTSLRARSSTVKIFQLSGFTDVVRKDLAKKISLLGGKYIDSQAFTGRCTHVICRQLSFSEKFLGALATGKYILHPDYLTASCHAGTFVDEERFEWCDEHIVKEHKVDGLLHLAIATRRCRFLLGNRSGAFEGWKVAVIAGASKSKVIQRLLISGGAEVFNMKIPLKNPAKVADMIGYVFVSEDNMKSVVQLIDYGVLCIRPEFIADFLVKDPQPDPMDYMVQLNNVNDLSTLEVIDPSSQNSFLMESQRSVYLTPQKLTSSQQSDLTSLTSSATSSYRPSSKLTHDCTDRNLKSEQPGPSHFVDVEVKAEDRVYEDVIDLTDDTERNDFRSECKKKSNKLESGNNTDQRKVVVKMDIDSFIDLEVKSEPEESTDVTSSRLTHDCTDRNLKSEQPGPSHFVDVEVKADNRVYEDVIDLTDDTERNDFRSECKKKSNKLESGNNTDQRKVVKMDTDSFIDLEVKSEPEESTDVTVRHSKRNLGRNSAIESLVPDRNSAGQVEDIKEEEMEVVSTNTKNEESSRTSSGRRGSCVKRNLMDSLNEHTKPTIQITSTPQKSQITKEHLIQARLNMSSITKFFKRIELSAESRTDRQNKSDITYRPVCLSPVQYCQLNKSDPVNVPTDSAISSDENANFRRRLNMVTDKSDKNNLKEKEQSKKIIVSVEDIVNDRPRNKQNDSVITLFSEKQGSDDNRNRKRKSPDSDKAGAFSPEHSTCKRTRRSTPTKKEENLVVKTPGKNPDIDSFTTIFISPSRKKSSTVNPFEIKERSPVQTSEELQQTQTSSQICERNSSQGGTGLDMGKKRKKADHDLQLQHVIKDIKRREISSGECCTSMISADLFETEDSPESVCMASANTEIFWATIEEGFTLKALQYLSSQITFKYYPESQVISEVMRNVLLIADEEMIANISYNILSRMLLYHPPITAALQDVYLRALAGCKEGEERQVGAEWNFIDQCLSNILTNDDSRFWRNNLLLFRVILQLLQQNLKHRSVSKTESDSRHLLLRIIWSPSYHVVFNRRCRTLVETMSDVVKSFQANSEKSELLEVLDGVLWMVAMVTECCRIQECGNVDKMVALQANSTSAFVHEISRKLIDLDVRDPVLLERIFKGLQLPWLKVGVCQLMLNELDDYLLAEDSLQDAKSLSFLLIVTRYIYLLPVFDVKPGSQGFHSPARTKTKQTTEVSYKKCLTENTYMNKENIAKMTLKVKKRNPKGETPLHVACRRNNIVEVKRLLKVPGIDVNATDHVGWTPLHEACNHGNIECVMELLKFVPSKTMDAFFNKGSTVCRKVNLLAGNGEGITPLHDAVLNDQVDVCRVLLQHGGPKLLQAQTILGYTPLDLAETDDMAALLTSYSHDDCLNLIGSQDSTCSTEENVPQEFQYEQVLYMNGERVYVNIKSAIHYVRLVTLLVKHYIAFRNLLLICDAMKCQPSIELSEQGHRENKMLNSSCNAIESLSLQDSQNCNCQTEQTSDCVSNTSRVKQSSLKYERAVHDIDQDEFSKIKNDMKILKNMSHYIKLFRAHLLKICRPEDSNVIENELQKLIFVTEILWY